MCYRVRNYEFEYFNKKLNYHILGGKSTLDNLGLATKEANQATYLTLWKTNQDSLKRNLGAIKKVSDFIIQKIDEIAAEDPSNKDSQPEQK